ANKYGFNCIHHAALRGNTNSMECLLKNVIDLEKNWLIDEKKEDGVKRLNYDISKLLIECQINSVKQCNINLQDKDGDTSLHCLLRNYTISQLKNQKGTAQENNNLSSIDLNNRLENLNITSEPTDKVSYSNLACLLIDNGASLYIKNNKNQTPIDLCNDSNFIKFLIKYNHDVVEARKDTNKNPSETLIKKEKDLNECPICCEKKLEILLKPCNHVNACEECSSRLKKCLICKEQIQDRIKLDNCMICED
ncbi:unnamed protein product, partial [Brachionus calyciflorus]